MCYLKSIGIRELRQRAVRAHGDDAVARAREVLQRLAQLAVDDDVLEAAELLDVADLRRLDTIHLATALRLRSDLDCLVTYDARMAKAAATLGIEVMGPR